jgi:hypothetical protein
MKKCNECGQVINSEMYNDIIKDLRLHYARKKRQTKTIGLDTLGEILLELKKEFIDNPKNITQLVDQLVDDIKNKDQE